MINQEINSSLRGCAVDLGGCSEELSRQTKVPMPFSLLSILGD